MRVCTFHTRRLVLSLKLLSWIATKRWSIWRSRTGTAWSRRAASAGDLSGVRAGTGHALGRPWPALARTERSPRFPASWCLKPWTTANSRCSSPPHLRTAVSQSRKVRNARYEQFSNSSSSDERCCWACTLQLLRIKPCKACSGARQ